MSPEPHERSTILPPCSTGAKKRCTSSNSASGPGKPIASKFCRQPRSYANAMTGLRKMPVCIERTENSSAATCERSSSRPIGLCDTRSA
eukprot:3105185-Prymnesium_polylepis.1